jgi:hydrogenase maturation protease
MNTTSADRPRILVAGVGNIFLGDDAFGCEVAQRLSRRPLAEGVRVVDFGIRGLDLAYTLLDGYQAVIIVDAVPRGGAPGTLYVLEPDLEKSTSSTGGAPLMETHNMDPARVLRLVTALGGQIEHVLIVGCEPETTGDESDMPIEMSPAVRAAVDEAVGLVESLIAKMPWPDESTNPEKEGQACHP